MYRYFDNKSTKIHLSYFKHCLLSLYFAHRMFVCSLKSVVHGFMPLFFKKSIIVRARNIPIPNLPTDFKGAVTISSKYNNSIVTATIN